MHKALDPFILETFYSFTVHKKLVRLDLNELYFVKNKEIINLVVNPMRRGIYNDLKGNMVKPFVFAVFQHVQRINIQAPDFPFDLVLFLKLLNELELPESLEHIVVEGVWLENARDKLGMDVITGIVRGKFTVDIADTKLTLKC